MWGEMTYVIRFMCGTLGCMQRFEIDCGTRPDVERARGQARAHGWRGKNGEWHCPEHAPEVRLGGEAVRDKYGSDYFTQLGRKGGEANRDRNGSEHYRHIGRQGGVAKKMRRGQEEGA